MVGCPLSVPPPHHHQKQACALVFDGGLSLASTATPPPSKVSMYTRFWWWVVLCQYHHPTIIENKHMHLFLMVVCPLPALPPHHSKASTYAHFWWWLSFVSTTTPPSLKMSMHTNFWRCFVPYQHCHPTTMEMDKIHLWFLIENELPMLILDVSLLF